MSSRNKTKVALLFEHSGVEFFVDVSCMLIGKVVGEFLCSLGNKLV